MTEEEKQEAVIIIDDLEELPQSYYYLDANKKVVGPFDTYRECVIRSGMLKVNNDKESNC